MASLAEIEDLAAKIVREFQPEKVILFGSHARGEAGPNSDVDLLVVVPFVGKAWRKAAEIRNRVQARFPLDLLVRSPDEMQWRVTAGDPFLSEVAEQGVELHAPSPPRYEISCAPRSASEWEAFTISKRFHSVSSEEEDFRGVSCGGSGAS